MLRICVGLSVLSHAIVFAAAALAQVSDVTTPPSGHSASFQSRIDPRAHIHVFPPPPPRIVTPNPSRYVNDTAAPLAAPVGIRPERVTAVEPSTDEREDLWMRRGTGCRCILPLAANPLMPLVNVVPQYPKEAAAAGVEGTVTLVIAVAIDGSVEAIRVVNGPAQFARAAADAVQNWRFAPPTYQGGIVPVSMFVRFVFRLDE